MYKYVNESGKFDIVPSVKEMPKHEILDYRAGYTHNKFTYSDGLVVESIVEPKRVTFLTNVELEQKSDGKYYPKL